MRIEECEVVGEWDSDAAHRANRDVGLGKPHAGRNSGYKFPVVNVQE